MLTFEELDTFRTIVRAGTFRRAAEELFVTQPAISQRVRHLERVLGCRLFHRDQSRRTLTLTAEGERVLQFADEVARLYAEVRRDVSDAARLNLKQCAATLACGATPAKYILPCLLLALYEQHRHVQVRVLHSSGADINAAVLDGRAEVGIQTAALIDGPLGSVPLLRDRLVLIAPPRVEGSWDYSEILKCGHLPFAVPPPGTELRQLVEWWATSLGLAVSPVVESASHDVLKEVVMRGLGLAVVSEYAVVDDLRRGVFTVLHVKGFPKERDLRLVYDLTRPLSPGAQVLVDLARDGAWQRFLPRLTSSQSPPVALQVPVHPIRPRLSAR